MKIKTLRPLLFLTAILFLLAGNLVSPAKAESNITVNPRDASNSGAPGTIVTYSLTVTNNTDAEMEVYLSESSMDTTWVTTLQRNSLTIPGASSRTVTVSVLIPSGATGGDQNLTTVDFAKTPDGKPIATARLTTTVSEPAVGVRPLVVISTYSAGDGKIYAGQEFGLTVGLRNKGQTTASNVKLTFSGSEFYPTQSGGVQTVGHIDPGESNSVVQKFIIGEALAWQGVASLTADVTYNDPMGTEYAENFTLSITITPPVISGSGATATPNVPLRPQLVVIGYKTDVDPLQPGTLFNLKLDVKNLGMADAKTVTVVLGGGVSPGGDAGTPSGGVSGGSGDLANFAPIGSSNLIYVGDISKESVITVNQKLVVNVSTEPGAYSFKLSFVYDDTKGNRLVDDQVITLLVYSLPQVEISFYRDAGVFSAGMENILPLQVTNLGNGTSILGNMKVTAENAEVMNNISLVGALDPGGYFTLDTTLIPAQEGPLDIKVSINYTDDFNQPRFFEQVIPIVVQPAMEEPPAMGVDPVTGEPIDGEFPVESATETFWQKLGRFFKGLFGLDSGKDQPEVIPTEEFIPVPGIPKG